MDMDELNNGGIVESLLSKQYKSQRVARTAAELETLLMEVMRRS